MKVWIVKATLWLIILFFACKKETSSVPGAMPAKGNIARIAVKLNSTYLPVEKIDSAILLWENNGQLQQERMQLTNDTLFTTLTKLNKGEGRLTIQIFSKVELRNKKLQFEKRSAVTLRNEESLNLAAPTGYDDPVWFPRVVLIDDFNQFTAIIALRPADPYFLLKNVPHGFKIELERIYAAIPGGAVIIGAGLWKCNTNCADERGIVENREFFKPLQAQIGNRVWKMVEVGVGLFGPNGTSGGVLYFNHW
jgi:hypothetical protein